MQGCYTLQVSVNNVHHMSLDSFEVIDTGQRFDLAAVESFNVELYITIIKNLIIVKLLLIYCSHACQC